MNEVKEIIDGLLKLQDKIMKKEKWTIKEAEKNVGNIAQIEIYDVFGKYSDRLKLDKNYRIVRTNEKPKHIIRMHIDTFIDLLLGERDGEPFDFGKAWVQGLVEFQGEDYITHAMKWAEVFSKLRKYLDLVK